MVASHLTCRRCFCPSVLQHSNADPPIKAYAPTLVYTDETPVTVESLRSTIADIQVTDAALVYRKLVAENVAVEPALKQQLLELLCYHNHEDAISADLIEERWHSQSSIGKERLRKTWHDHDLAEQLFAEIEPRTERSYAAIIRGMAKYCQVERAWSLFQEATERGHRLDVATYNAVIAVSNFLKESGDMRWQLAQDLLQRMRSAELRPDADTLNAVLQLISTIGGYRQSREYALQTLAEFRAIGVEPTLASWYFVLAIFCRERGPVSHVLIDILHQIEGRSFQIRHAKDVFFFVTAMDVCRNHLGDKELAKRVDKLLHTGNNYDLLGDSYKESIYYRHYFGLLCGAEPLEQFFAETYDRLVPHVYIPEPGIMAEILKQVDVNGALEWLPRLWSDMVQFDHVQREALLQQVLRIMVENRPREADLPAHVGLEQRFGEIAWQIWEKIETQPEGRTQQLTWTGQMLGDVLQLCCRQGEWSRAADVFAKLDREAHRVAGTPAADAVETFVRGSVEQRQPSRAIAGLQYHVERGLGDSQRLAREIVAALTLDETHLSKIHALVGAVEETKPKA